MKRAMILPLVASLGSCAPRVEKPTVVTALPLVNSRLLADAHHGAIIGTVVDGSTKAPLRWVQVRAHNLADSSITYAQTDSAGGFYTAPLIPGEYLITARRVGYEQFAARLSLVAGVVDTLRATLTANDIRLHSTSEPLVGGFRRDPELAMVIGSVTDSVTGKPLAGANAYIAYSNYSAVSTTADTSGRFVLPYIAPGRRKIRVRLMGYVAFSRELDLRAGGVDSINVVLPRDTHRLIDVITDNSQTPGMHVFPDRTHGILIGIVIDSTTERPPRFEVAASLVGSTSSLFLPVTPAVRGQFIFGPFPGLYRLSIQGFGYKPFIEDIQVKAGAIDTVVAHLVRDATGVLDRIDAGGVALPHIDTRMLTDDSLSAVIGTVSDPSGRRFPYPMNVMVESSDRSIIGKVLTDSLGGFVLPRIIPGSYRIFIRQIGYVTYSANLQLRAGAVDTVAAKMARDTMRLMLRPRASGTPLELAQRAVDSERDPERHRPIPVAAGHRHVTRIDGERAAHRAKLDSTSDAAAHMSRLAVAAGHVRRDASLSEEEPPSDVRVRRDWILTKAFELHPRGELDIRGVCAAAAEAPGSGHSRIREAETIVRGEETHRRRERTDRNRRHSREADAGARDVGELAGWSHNADSECEVAQARTLRGKRQGEGHRRERNRSGTLHLGLLETSRLSPRTVKSSTAARIPL